MSKNSYKLFTSESVCAGHPDKIADRISDTILDALLKEDVHTKAGIETVVGANKVVLLGEIKSKASVDYEKIVQKTVRELGYTNPDWGFSDKSAVEVLLHEQSAEIALGTDDDKGAGDQGMMFGYAINHTDNFMPLPITIAHELTKRLDFVRTEKILPFIRPDGKSQVTIRFENDKPVAIEKLVIATAHDEKTTADDVRSAVTKEVILSVLNAHGFSVNQKDIIVNGTGLWHIPGPSSDAGLTGRKIVVDTYGGWARVGGGAFSGKDPSKVDRSGAYAARFIAKNIIANGFADECEVGLAYVIGQPNPLMKSINCFDSQKVSDKQLAEYADSLLDTSVKGIIEALHLRKPIYQPTSSYGHFGNIDYSWEKIVQ